MAGEVRVKNWLLGAVGAIVGGVVGYFLTGWVARQGFYALAVPRALMGLGCGFLSGVRFNAIGVACGVAAIALGLFTEWMLFPFVADDSLGYFMAHVFDLKPMSLLMIALGGYLGWSFGRGRDLSGPSRSREDAAAK